MKLMTSLFLCLFVSQVQATTANFYGDLLLRYENEGDHVKLADRERLRLIAHAGIKLKVSDTWTFDTRLSTGLKNKQNVPAITLYRFNQQPRPDTDVYVDRFYVKGTLQSASIWLGKIPWKSKQVTDLFWDRHLNPLGIHIDLPVFSNQMLQLASFKPLDGNDGTVGHMTLIQYHHTFSFDKLNWSISPWYVHYSGEENARYAKKDTALDNRFIRLSSKLSYRNFQLGVDLGRSLETFEGLEQGEFADQKSSYAVELKYGKLSHVGAYQAHLRYMHVERFGAIQEFAQNAVSRFATTNFKGFDFRLRKKMGNKWWIGMRFSDTEKLVGNKEEGIRFRIETQYKF